MQRDYRLSTAHLKELAPTIAESLAALGITPQGKNLRCPNPAHDDQSASATLNEDNVFCHVCARAFDRIDLWAFTKGIPRERSFAEFRREFNPAPDYGAWVPEITYSYHDETGAELFQVCRKGSGSSKEIRQRRMVDGLPAWSLKEGHYTRERTYWKLFPPGETPPEGSRFLGGIVPPLYRLPELLSNKEPVYICEGEKAVESLRDLGLVATTNPGGAGKWRGYHSTPLAMRECYILADNDETGRKHARMVAESLSKVCVRAKLLELPGLPEKGDVYDWVKAGGTREQLLELAAAAQEITPPNTPESKEEKCADDAATEIDLRDRWISKHAADFRYDFTGKCWYHWDGRIWAPDGAAAALHAMAEIASDCEEAKLKKASAVRGALGLAAAHPAVAIDPAILDAAPHLLTCKNGTLDLKTGYLRPHSRDDLITRFVDLDYDKDAQCPRFMRFLDEIHPGDPEVTQFLLGWFGYCLTGETREQAVVFFTGSGRNGKGILIEAVRSVLGDFYAAAPEGLLTVQKFQGHPTELWVLRGRRLVVASELNKTDQFNAARLKQLSGGDVVQARAMRADFGAGFLPTFKITLLANHKPRVSDDSPAFWARMRVVPFPVSFLGREDRKLLETLLAERQGILALFVQHAALWYAEGLTRPDSVLVATKAYQAKEDTIGGFLDSLRAERGALIDIPAGVMLEEYQSWAEANGARELNSTSLARALRDKGWESTRAKTSEGRRTLWSEAPCQGYQGLPISTKISTRADDAQAHAGAHARTHAHGARSRRVWQPWHGASRLPSGFLHNRRQRPRRSPFGPLPGGRSRRSEGF